MKKVLKILSGIVFVISVVLLIFGFGESGFAILHECSFWAVVNALWTLTVLLLVVR